MKNNDKNDINKEKINYKIVDQGIEKELQKQSDKIWKNKLILDMEYKEGVQC